MRCGNDPRAQLTPGDRTVVEEFHAYLAAKADDPHRWERAGEGRNRCTVCGVAVVQHLGDRYNRRLWLEYVMPSGWSWYDDTGNDGPPPCPPPPVEALCPWEPDAMRYARAKGDDQLDTAMRTWCATHECAVSDCPEPGPHCPGAMAHEYEEPGFPGPCTGRSNTCRCMCPACCGDTPDVWGAPNH
ncbi:hypothetical protein ACIA7S_28685 [Streptomyces sp. NPDC051643]|uniref:hypothetical protein n=1 Tax=Streptomyces sp. NPDC051643 TaxID=3365665 RepID=UPI00379EACE4